MAETLRSFTADNYDVANSVKWAIEKETKIACVFVNDELRVLATPKTAEQLRKIADTITGDFQALWNQFRSAGAHPSDRGLFIRGLYDGMAKEEKAPGEPLPQRYTDTAAIRNRKKRALNAAPGLSLHPYSVAVELGKQVRFTAPLADISAELDRTIKGALKQ